MRASGRSSDGPWRDPSPGAGCWTPLGLALERRGLTGRHQRIDVLRERGRSEELSTEDLERSRGYPEAEELALALTSDLAARGSAEPFRVLDLGSGAGTHARKLGAEGLHVTSLEIEPRACVAQARLRTARVVRGTTEAVGSEAFDCVLLLMNGLGVAGDVPGLGRLLGELRRIVRPGGVVLTDGCDLRRSDDARELRLVEDRVERGVYFGQAWMQLSFAGCIGPRFPWLYVDPELLRSTAAGAGARVQIVFESDDGAYLARISF